MKLRWLVVVVFLAGCGQAPEVRVGSKKQPESVILGEMVALLAGNTGARVDYQRGRALGGTEFLWKALINDEIDVYPEYTGTISAEILAGKDLRKPKAMREALAEYGIRMSQPLGFNDTYALGMKKESAERLGIRTISDLRKHPGLKLGFSNEFMVRADDGWKGLRERYRLPQKPLPPLEHDLAYQALVNGALDVTDLYSTDAKIRSYKLQVLADDLHFFPSYQAVLLYRSTLQERNPSAVAAFLRLEGRILEDAMIDLNARVELAQEKESQVAADFLAENLGVYLRSRDDSRAAELLRLTRQHLFLVAISLGAAMVVAVPLGILAARWPGAGQGILAVSGVIQTIPSIALLVFLIPLLGIGAQPTIAALFLYSLLPIVQNTYTGLHNIPGQLRESAEALGLSALARLRLVELPMASRTIVAGIKTAAVINVGTATLGGLIGAGGFGEVIFNGIPKGDFIGLILWGAVPAALLALFVLGLFELAERWLVPKGLRLKAP
jgi:osmoprotectant transport system permease protein